LQLRNKKTGPFIDTNRYIRIGAAEPYEHAETEIIILNNVDAVTGSRNSRTPDIP
jgi:hypothetical protein